MRALEKFRETRSNALFDAVLASAELANQQLKMSASAESWVAKRNAREAAVKTYLSIFRILDKVTFTREQTIVINRKMDMLRISLM